MTDDIDPAGPQAGEARPAREGGPAPLFLQTLICPISRTALTYDRARSELVSKAAGLAFPVREGVPIMLEDEARQLTDAELA
jgi:uncharacterized protein YbaR (Trm112 family)